MRVEARQSPAAHTFLAIAVAAVAVAAAVGCGRGSDAETSRRTATVAEALRPGFFAAALRKAGGAHVRVTSRFAAGPAGGPSDAVTTTTDVWLDRQTNYRLRELNDRDGGREVIHTGRELAVALRYGKMTRRAAEEPEPTRLLEEALGAPWAAWELMAPSAAVTRAGSELHGGVRATAYTIGLGAGGGAAAAGADSAGALPFAGLRAWRGSVKIKSLQGRVLVDDATGAVMRADLASSFTLTNEGRALAAEVEVHAVASEVAAVPQIERPPAEDLALRQRTLPEQKELLSGIAPVRAAAEGQGTQRRAPSAPAPSPGAGGKRKPQ